MKQNQTWDTKLSELAEFTGKAKLDTGADGKKQIQHDVDRLTDNGKQTFNTAVRIKKQLDDIKVSLDDFNALHRDLSKWLADAESSLKDNDARSTLQEKKIALQKLQASFNFAPFFGGGNSDKKNFHYLPLAILVSFHS